ncbi:glycosyltransferase family 2 protein [Anaerobacillus sp. HL2]|nr:glycosyltransferase family 2 protein [Anaerobacillus sp. HL2]
MSLANGDWIAFLDSDDMWKKDKLHKQVASLEDNEVEFIFTGSSFINELGSSYQGILEVPDKVTYKSREHIM